ncbi:MAG: OsmC family protein [Lysobacterales bacterium]|jgi:organic hydroperoxide reductase OsmC/OhrA
MSHTIDGDKQHRYAVRVAWTGNTGNGTKDYRAYERAHEVTAAGKPPLACSADPAFRGDASRYNPEELLLTSLSGCHMLWYLHLCAVAGISVLSYADAATGTMVESADGGGHFAEVVLHPEVTVAADADTVAAAELHDKAHELCFIANSVSFPVRCEAAVVAEGLA